LDNFRLYTIGSNQKLNTIKILRQIISDHLLQLKNVADNNGNTSFLQMTEFNSKARELKTLLSKSNDNKYTPLFTTLLSIAETKVNQDVLKQLDNVLEHLLSSIDELQRNEEARSKKDIETLKEAAHIKKDQTNTLAKLIANNRAKLEENNLIVSDNKKKIESLKEEINRKNEEYNKIQWLIQKEEVRFQKEENRIEEFRNRISQISQSLFPGQNNIDNEEEHGKGLILPPEVHVDPLPNEEEHGKGLILPPEVHVDPLPNEEEHGTGLIIPAEVHVDPLPTEEEHGEGLILPDEYQENENNDQGDDVPRID
jgi:chromosome segregation ATPase